MTAKNKTKCTNKTFAYLLAGVAFYGFSSVVYADDAAIDGYKISEQIEEKKSEYLEESPYVQRQKRLENSHVKPEIRRRPMRFSTGETLPQMPRFDSYGTLDTGAEDNSVDDLAPMTPAVTVQQPSQAEQKMIEEVVGQEVAAPEAAEIPIAPPQSLPEVVEDVTLEETIAEQSVEVENYIPAELEVVKPEIVAPVPKAVMVEKVETPKSTGGVQPQSILDSVFSFWGDEEEVEPVAPKAVAPVELVKPKLLEPEPETHEIEASMPPMQPDMAEPPVFSVETPVEVESVPHNMAPVAPVELVKPKLLESESETLEIEASMPPMQPDMAEPPTLSVETPVEVESVPHNMAPVPPLGDPVKSVIIEKSPDGISSIQRTREIVVPPEIKELKEPSIIPIPPLALSQDRFVEDLIMPEPPVSAMAAIAKDAEAPNIAPTLSVVNEPTVEKAMVEPVEVETLAVIEQPVIEKVEKETPVAVVEPVEMQTTQAEKALLAKTEATEEIAVVESEPEAVESVVAEIEPEAVNPAAAMPTVDEVLQRALIMSEEPAEMAEEVVMVETPEAEIEKPVVVATATMDKPVVEVKPTSVPVKVPVMRHEVIMQPLGGQKSPLVMTEEKPVAEEKPAELAKAPAEAPKVVVEEAVEISADSKMMLRNFPSNLNMPEPEVEKDKVEISRATVPNLELDAPEVKKHEAMGISIQVNKPDIDVNDYLVMAYESMQASQFDLASEYYREILRHRPQNDDAKLGLATVYHQMGNLDEARKLYRQLLSNAPRDPAVLNNFLVLVSQESPREALNELTHLEAKNPYYDVLPAQISAIYANQGMMEEAIEKMARAISLSPENLLYQYNLAVMLDHAGRRKQAIQVYRQVKIAAQKGGKIPTDISHIQERLTFLLSNQTG